MGAGTGGKDSSVPHQFHSPAVDFPVSLNGLASGLPGLGKGWRIQDHHIISLPLLLQSGQFIQHIDLTELHPIRQTVPDSVFPGLLHREFGNIQARHFCRACQSRIQRKCSHMGKTVQHPLSPAETLHRKAIVFLIQEKSGFLPFCHIHQIAHPVFCDFHFGSKGIPIESLIQGHSLFPAHLGVRPFIDSADPDSVLPQHISQFR